MKEAEALLYARTLTRQVGRWFASIVSKHLDSGYLILDESLDSNISDCMRSLILRRDREKYRRTNMVVWTSYEGKLDYLPILHVMLPYFHSDWLKAYVPRAIEYGTTLDVSIPENVYMDKTQIIHHQNPLVYLLRADNRFIRFFKSISHFHNYETMIKGHEMHLNEPPVAEVVRLSNETFVGLRALPDLRGRRMTTITDDSTGVRTKTWRYGFEPLVFEVFARLAYYTKYVAYQGEPAPMNPEETYMWLPFILKGQEAGD